MTQFSPESVPGQRNCRVTVAPTVQTPLPKSTIWPSSGGAAVARLQLALSASCTMDESGFHDRRLWLHMRNAYHAILGAKISSKALSCTYKLIKDNATIAPACANRSCGPPKPGAAHENQADGAAGGPPGGCRGPMGPRRARGDAVACPWGPNINCAPIRESRATCRMTTCSELR